MWFESLVGFREKDPDQVRSNITVSGETMTSTANGRKMTCGRLEIPSLADLRGLVRKISGANGALQLSEVVGDVQKLHVDANNAGALFQVASQFNLLEMVSPAFTPEQGVEIYENDHTQGPACAIACGAGTIYRNYFAPVNGKVGQTKDNQIDCLHDLGIALGNAKHDLWEMQNGYALATAIGLSKISKQLSSADESQRDLWRAKLRIGLHWNTEVTLKTPPQLVTQAFCSALPVAYSTHPSASWAAFATLVLEAAYEATICAGIVNSVQTGNNKVFLTLLGGGAFGNLDEWIFSALNRALHHYADYNLDVAIVSYGASKPSVRKAVADFAGTAP